MPRKTRLWHPSAVYHIICRGNHRQDIFRDEEDRTVYRNRLFQAKHDHRCTVLSYCLMTNHVHLQLETSDVPISQMMKQLSMMYAIYFNRKYDVSGHLFQGRFRSELIATHRYLLESSRYIHLNPVRAALVQHPAEYKWSSFRDYLGLRSDPLVSVGRILSYFPEPPVHQYKCFVEQGTDPTTVHLPES